MDRDTVIALAREAGWPATVLHPQGCSVDTDEYQLIPTLERFAALVAKAERHRICEMLRERHKQEERHNYYGFIANMIEEMP